MTTGIRSTLALTTMILLTACEAPSEQIVLESTADVAALQNEIEDLCDPSALPNGGGNGTAEHPFLICSIGQLKLEEGYHYRLESDLDFTGVTFQPIEFGLNIVLDGNGYEIRNITADYRGSFTQLSSGVFKILSGHLKNMRFRNIDFKSSSRSGVVAATVNYDGIVENVKVYNSSARSYGTTSPGMFAGGIAAINYGTIRDCFTSIISQGVANFGGIVGDNYGLVENSDSENTLTNFYAARVVNYNRYEGTVRDCQYRDHSPQTNHVTVGWSGGIKENCD